MPTDALAQETSAAAVEIDRPARTVESLSKAVEHLSRALGLSKARSRELDDEPAKPDADELEDEYGEGEQHAANEEVESSRFKRGEPRDAEDERAERENAARQRRVTSKSRREEDDEEDERKSRTSRKSRRDEDEDERKSRRDDEEDDERKSRREDDEEDERKSRRTRKSEGDWDDDEDAKHGRYEDPADGRAEGADDADDDTIITNQGRRMRRNEKSLREVYYRDLGKSKQAVQAVEVSDVINHLASVFGDSVDALDKAQRSTSKDVRALSQTLKLQGEVLVGLAAAVSEIHKSWSAAPAELPHPGVVLNHPGASKGSAPKYTIPQVRKALQSGISRGIVGSTLAANFDSQQDTFIGNQRSLEDWVRLSLTDDERAGLGL